MKRVRMLFLLIAALLPALAGAVVTEFPLTRFLPFPSLELRCVADEQTIEVPVPLRWNIRSVKLKLYYAVSTALLAKTSNLLIKVNGTPVMQTKLVSISADDPLSVVIPVGLFKPGYNKLTFAVSQHYSDKECELPCSSSLWTSIKIPLSTLTFDYEMRAVPRQLSSVSEYIFDPKLATDNRVHLAFNTTDDQVASLAAVAASGVARRFDYRKVTFSVSDILEYGRDNVVIGTDAFVRPLLGNALPPATDEKGGLLKILPMRRSDGTIDEQHALIVVTGKTMEEVKLAAMTLANISLAYPGSDELRAVGFSLPEISAYGGRNIISSDKVYSFKTLDAPTRTMAGLNAQAIRINFRLPADFLIKQNRTVELILNFAYGAGMRPDSALNVIVNDQAVRAIPLQNPEGGFFEKYKLDIPTYVFRPGDNSITFSPELHVAGRECDVVQPGNLFFTLFDNSTFKFPYMPHFIDMPRLELFMLNGFPFTRWPDGFEGSIYITRPSVDSLSAAMNLVGLMTQKNGFPLLNMALTYKPPNNSTGDLIVIGDVFSVPKELAVASPLQVGKTARIPYPIIRSWQMETNFAFSDQVSRMGSNRGLMMEFESPFQAGRSALLFAADEQADLVRLSEQLLDPEIQSQINGDLIIFEFLDPKTKVTALSVGKRYTTGKQGKVDWIDTGMDRLDSLLYANKAVFYGLLVVALAGLSWVLFVAIRRYRIRRLKTVAGKGD